MMIVISTVVPCSPSSLLIPKIFLCFFIFYLREGGGDSEEERKNSIKKYCSLPRRLLFSLTLARSLLLPFETTTNFPFGLVFLGL
jgi:hypothetical protein